MEPTLQLLLDKLESIEKLLVNHSTDKRIVRSEHINELATSLSLAQVDYKPVSLQNKNSYSSIAFASLQGVTDATRPALGKNALCVFQDIFDHEDGSSVLHTVLVHNSGQFIESQMRIKPNGNEPASLTSYINWMKRTSYSSLVGCPIPAEDDDAESYIATQRKLPARGSAAQRKDLSYDVISKTQLSELEYELNGFPDTAEEILELYELQNIADLPQEKYRSVITKVREIKQKLSRG
jgi:hypothetical protein